MSLRRRFTMPDPLVLPEIARSLRSLGAPRDVASESAHDAIFSPLLAARARASNAELALSSFAGETLAASIEARASAAAQVNAADAAQARARSALAIECLERLRDELLHLDRLGQETPGPRADAAALDRWIEQLRRVFAEADRACIHLSTVLADASVVRPPARRWFNR